MKKVLSDVELEKLVNAYQRLGFGFYLDERIAKKKTVKNINADSVRVSYTNEDNQYTSKRLVDIMATDLHSAYMYSNKIADSKNDLLANNYVFLLLFNTMTKDTDKDSMNKSILKFLKKNSDYIDEKDYLAEAYYTHYYGDIYREKTDNVIDTKIIENIKKDINSVKKESKDIDYDKIKELIYSALYENKPDNKSNVEENTKNEDIKQNENINLNDNINNNETTDFVLVDNKEEETIKNDLVTNNNTALYRYSKADGFKNVDVINPPSEIKNNSTTVNTENNLNKRIKVVNVEENKEVANTAKKKINKESILITAGIIILASAVWFAVHNNKYSNEKNTNQITIENTNDNNITVESIEEDNTKDIEKNKAVEEPEVVVEETIVDETTEEPEIVAEEIDVQSDEYIERKTESIYNYIQNTELASTYTKDDIRNIIRYAHHSYDNFNSENILSNESAYEIYTTFVKHRIDLSMLDEGLKGYEDLQNLDIAMKNIVQELGKYDDEYKAFKAIETTLNNMDDNNFTEAVALRAYTDLYTLLPSMQVVRGGALENGEEGQTYYDEKASVDATKTEECKNIYNEIDVNNQNAKLTRIVIKALDEDDAKVRTR